MSAHLSEEEQIEALKRWWKDYGKTVVAAVAIGLGGFFSWNYYQDQKVEQAQARSAAFETLISTATEQGEDLSEQQLQQLQAVASELAQSDSLYADFSELYLAKLAVEQDDLDKAAKHLQKVAAAGSNEAVKDLAGLRLARVLAAKGDVDGALTILSAKPSGAYAAVYAEARGDILLNADRLQDAQTAYQHALASVGNEPMRRNILQLKLDNTRVANATDIMPGAPAPGSDPHAVSNPHAMPDPHSSEGGGA